MSNPSTPGGLTSEFRITAIVAILGAVVSGLTVALGSLQESFPDIGWIGMVAGALTTIAPVISYVNGRSKVKAAAELATASTAQALKTPILTPANPSGPP